jgi:hypothetical protein
MNPISRRGALAMVGAAVSAGPAFAIDKGKASGRFNDDGVDFKVSHAIALAMDNLEGFPDAQKGYRVLLSDREVPVSALYGLTFPPVWRMARTGKLNGLLLRFDPADRNSLVVTVLTKRDDGYQPATITLSNSAGVWKRLEASATRVVGELGADASNRMLFDFTAPVFTNAVEADLRGPAAQQSEQVKVLLARAQALSRGDMAAVAALSTAESVAEMSEYPPEVMKQAPQFAAQLIRELRRVRRVVVRRETAAVQLGPNAWSSLARVDGAWKAA